MLQACGGRQAGGPGGQPQVGALKPAKVVFRVNWNPDVVPNNERMPKVREAFVASHPGWDIEWFYTPEGPGNTPHEKLVAAIVGGDPPDTMVLGGHVVTDWAVRNVLTPLEPYLSKSRISDKDYWAPSWRQHLWQGKTWALAWNTDVNFAMLWSKQVFEEAGLNSERGPQTVDELDDMHRRMTRREGGRLTRLGFNPPWETYGRPNSIFTWGWVFGAEFYDEKSQKVTADHPRAVAALEWMVEWAKRAGGLDQIAEFKRLWGARENSPIFVGHIGMRPVHGGYAEDIERYAPAFRGGFGHLPTGPGGAKPKAAWVGGWSLGLTVGAKQPEQGWELMRWLSQSQEGTTWLGREVGWYPAYVKSPFWEAVQKDSKRAIFYEIVKEARYQRPVMPVNAEYFALLDKAVDKAVKGEQTARVVLQEATREAQRLLDERLKKG